MVTRYLPSKYDRMFLRVTEEGFERVVYDLRPRRRPLTPEDLVHEHLQEVGLQSRQGLL